MLRSVETPSSPSPGTGSYRVLHKLTCLLSAHWLRDGLQAVFLIYLARMSSSTFGEFMLALETGAILLLVADFGLNLPLVRFLNKPEADPEVALGQASIIKAGLLSLGWGGVWGLVLWQGYATPFLQVVLVVSAGVGLEALANTFFVTLQVRGLQSLEGKIRSLAAILGFTYAFLSLAWAASPLTLAFFKVVENLANLFMVGGVLVRAGQWRCRWPSSRGAWAMARQGIVFWLMSVAAIIYAKTNLFFIQRYGGSEQVAQYSATWPLVDGASALASSLLMQGVLFPLFVQLFQADRLEVSRLARDTARWLLLVALVLMFLLSVEADRLIPLIFGPHYQEAVWLQKILVFVIPFSLLHSLAQIILVSLGLERLLLAIFLAALGFNLTLCYFIIPFSPLLGAAVAILLTKVGVACLIISYTHRRLGLLSRQDLPRLVLAALAGLALYLGARPFLPRELAELAALAPLLGLGWWWKAGGGPGT